MFSTFPDGFNIPDDGIGGWSIRFTNGTRFTPPAGAWPRPLPAAKEPPSALDADAFQNYLLDIANQSPDGLYAIAGEERGRESVVSNWLRSLGLEWEAKEIDSTTTYLLYLPDGTLYGSMPLYLVRFEYLLYDDVFTHNDIPVYQALAALSYITTTERYRSATQ